MLITGLVFAVAVSSVSAKATGHRAPSSRCASCGKPNVAYLVLSFEALSTEDSDLLFVCLATPSPVVGRSSGYICSMPMRLPSLSKKKAVQPIISPWYCLSWSMVPPASRTRSIMPSMSPSELR